METKREKICVIHYPGINVWTIILAKLMGQLCNINLDLEHTAPECDWVNEFFDNSGNDLNDVSKYFE